MTKAIMDDERILRLAHPRGPSSGRCSWCDENAISWERSDRRDTDADGLTLACRACASHEPHATLLLRRVTLTDIVRMTPRGRRAHRAAQARRQAAYYRSGSRAYARSAADMAGASSLTHTHRLVSGYRGMQADALDALADALGAE